MGLMQTWTTDIKSTRKWKYRNLYCRWTAVPLYPCSFENLTMRFTHLEVR